MTLSQLIESVSIVEYISQYVELTEKNGELWGLSPFCEENTPSFSVREEQGFFYDFSSGKGGNILGFIKEYHKCNTSQAADMLRVFCGEEGESGNPSNQRMCATLVAKHFTPAKREPKKSTAKILPPNYMERYLIDLEKLNIWEREGISLSSMEKFQVRYDDFSQRLVFPIRRPNGEIINVSGRTVDPQWKEKGLRKYTYFQSFGVLDTLYGLWESEKNIQEKREILVFEGAKSVMVANSWGFHNAVAILTSHVNPQQLQIFATLGCRVVFALDKGVDISTDKNINKLKRYAKIEVVVDQQNFLQDKESPVDQGQEVWKTLYERRMTYR